MKYTRYIMNEKPIDTDSLGAIGAPLALLALPFLTFMLSGAVVMDLLRYHKLRYHLWNRAQRNKRYAKCVLRSLDAEVNDYTINMLLVA